MHTRRLKKTAYLPFQGRNNTQTQFSSLLGGDDYISTTGQIVSRLSQEPDCIYIIPRERLWIGKEIKEIDFNYNDSNFFNWLCMPT